MRRRRPAGCYPMKIHSPDPDRFAVAVEAQMVEFEFVDSGFGASAAVAALSVVPVVV